MLLQIHQNLEIMVTKFKEYDKGVVNCLLYNVMF